MNELTEYQRQFVDQVLDLIAREQRKGVPWDSVHVGAEVYRKLNFADLSKVNIKAVGLSIVLDESLQPSGMRLVATVGHSTRSPILDGANAGIIGLGPGPYVSRDSSSWPTEGFDSALVDYNHDEDDAFKWSGHTREEWIDVADEMLKRWQEFRTALDKTD